VATVALQAALSWWMLAVQLRQRLADAPAEVPASVG
jgi:hypothetical protein